MLCRIYSIQSVGENCNCAALLAGQSPAVSLSIYALCQAANDGDPQFGKPV